MKILLTLYLLFQVSCDNDDDNNARGFDSKIDKKHLLIAAVLVPDEYRRYHTNVYVGEIRPSKDPEVFPSPKDKHLAIVIGSIRAHWVVDFEGIADAKVILKKDDKDVTLSHKNSGYYEDLNDEMDISFSNNYSLEVIVNGVEYYSETTIPGKFKITFPVQNDTVKVEDIYNPRLGYSKLLSFKYDESINSLMYRAEKFDNESNIKTLDHTLDENDFMKFYRDQTEIKYIRSHTIISALDENFSKIYSPESTFTYSTEWDFWYTQKSKKSVEEQSSIFPNNGVLGVFGSIAVDTVEFIAYADTINLKK